MVNLIPVPNSFIRGEGSFSLNDLSVKSDFELPLLNLPKADDAKLVIKNNSDLSKEAYILDIKEQGITIEAGDEAGAYYALQSLRQISRYELGAREVMCCTIKDAPRLEWRGLQLDSSRHFWSVDEIKRQLDMMFMMKLNVFHWHITDDQGWRIEIKKYPLLTEIGSKRCGSQVGGWHSFKVDKTEYSGYYTQEDIKDIVDYASKRNIMIVPEVDFPAHCAAALAAYPQLACRELKRDVPYYFGGDIPNWRLFMWDWNRTICAGKDDTMQFVFDVIDEVCDLFPAPYFHIGGDEAPMNEWKKCPLCQKRMKDNGLNTERELQGWFNNQILEHLKAKNKQLIGWNEILASGNLDKSVIPQYWTPARDERVEAHSKAGGKVIMSKHQSFYFDMPYAMYPLKDTYDFKPENYGVDEANVLGVEGEAWTEWIDTRERLDMMIYPRLQAMSEVAWSAKEQIHYTDFTKRLDAFKPFFKALGYNYAVDAISTPQGKKYRNKVKKLFSKGDTHFETKENKKLIEQGEK